MQALFDLSLFVVHLLTAARAITRPNREPAARVAWVAVIMFLPLLGVISYLFLGETSIGRERMLRWKQAEERTARPDHAAHAPQTIAPEAIAQFELCGSINGLGPVAGNRITLLGAPQASSNQPTLDSDSAIDALVRDIEQAREHVHVSFYIWLDDSNGGKVADAVAAAARRGVRCRVMADALGSRAFVQGPRWRQLADTSQSQYRATRRASLQDGGHLREGRLRIEFFHHCASVVRHEGILDAA